MTHVPNLYSSQAAVSRHICGQ